MYKKLISLAFVVALALNANALNILSDLNSTSWGSNYHKKSHTITFNEPWAACGWWADGADYSAFESIDVEIEPSTLTLDLVIEYAADGTQSTVATFEPGTANLSATINPTNASAVKSMYLKCHDLSADPKVKVISANLTPKALEGALTIFEGDFNLGNWDQQLEIPMAKFAAAKEGTKIIISYTFNEGFNWGSFNLNWVSKSWKWVPMTSITTTAGYDEQNGCVTVNTPGSVTITLDKKDAENFAKGGQMVVMKGANLTITKISLEN